MSNKALSTVVVEERFIEYYQSQGYEAIPGSSLLDPSVPMTFVMSAGLVQVETAARLHGGRTGNRYALIQNCFRYFDLANVGTSAAHLSLFQMPGAFTFGPLSKRDSIAQIWQLLIQVYGFPADSLWVSYFAGGQVAGRLFEPDRESQRAWRDMGLPDGHIVGLGPEHNFWKQSASIVGKEHTPKCGPNTEVFFDRGSHLSCGPACGPGCGCGRFVEFLNTLFITLHLDDQADIVKPLDEPFTETVVGAERVAMLLQGASSVFEIDSIRPLIEHVHGRVNVRGLTMADQAKQERVMADHIRALLFLTADGAPSPGRGGRARLMRKLVREMLTSQQVLRIDDPAFIPLLVQTALNLYVDQQPQLRTAHERVLEYIEEERSRFDQTLANGRRYLDRILNRRIRPQISAQDVLDMEKRQGIPLPLLEAMLVQRNIGLDQQA
jgi:alanyl-tRNA synthetase